MNEDKVKKNPEWTQKVMNAIVKAQIYSQNNKEEVAHMLSKDGKKYFAMKAPVVKRAMTLTTPRAMRNRKLLLTVTGEVGELIFNHGHSHQQLN